MNYLFLSNNMMNILVSQNIAERGTYLLLPVTIFKINESPTEYKKRILHREVERQRRQEMASLYRTLLSLVRIEYFEGKRSIADHLSGTVKYIRHLKKRLDELIMKRDKLRELLNFGSSRDSSECSFGQEKTSVVVQKCTTGMEIILRTGLRGGLPLSKFLNVLNEEGMSIESCISTEARGRRLQIIELEVDEGKNIDVTELQEKLMDLVQNL